MGTGAPRKFWKQGSVLAQAQPCGEWTQVLWGELWDWWRLLLPVLMGPFFRLEFLAALQTWGFSRLLLKDSQADLHSQESNPGSSSIRGLLPPGDRS